MTKEETIVLLNELSQHISRADEIIKAIENGWKQDEEDDCENRPLIVSAETGVLGMRVHCQKFEDILTMPNYRKRSCKDYPLERFVMMNGVKFFEIGNWEGAK